jgi:phosphoribosylformylglycinamidine synthase
MRKKNLLDYHTLIIPGGFSYGDHLRAGAILGRKLISSLQRELKEFIQLERPILGICNGFQILVEAGLLPGFDGISSYPQAALAVNDSGKFECRWVHLGCESKGGCIFTNELKPRRILSMPVAHSEGKFVLLKEKERKLLEKLVEQDQLIFKYCDKSGEPANGKYPENPNGSLDDIAGICDPSGKILGMMPHPERAFFGIQLMDWRKARGPPTFGDGKLLFESLARYLHAHV